jgi:hypothetical protein
LVDIDLVIYGADGFVFAALTLALASALALDRGVLLRLSFFVFVIFVHCNQWIEGLSKLSKWQAIE